MMELFSQVTDANAVWSFAERNGFGGVLLIGIGFLAWAWFRTVYVPREAQKLVIDKDKSDQEKKLRESYDARDERQTAAFEASATAVQAIVPVVNELHKLQVEHHQICVSQGHGGSQSPQLKKLPPTSGIGHV